MGSHSGTRSFDLLVIGAGIYGVQAARTYLELHPDHNIVVLEGASEVGGVWSAERSYPYFFTQAPFDIYQFSDMDMEVSEQEEKEAYYKYFPAKKFTRYLDKYLDAHVYEGRSLRERIKCGERVERLWKEEGEGGEAKGMWHIQTSTGSNYSAPKVIDASGLTSWPNVPSITGAPTFKGTQVHSKDFAANSPKILQPNNSVVVLGGGKSAADVAYTCAKSGVREVHWIVRKSGCGPSNFLPPKPPIPIYTNSNSAFHTTMLASVTASIYTPQNWWTWFLYQTTVGQALLRFIWRNVHADVLGYANYDREDGKKNGFANLKPDGTEETFGPMFWQNAPIGISQRPDFFDTIAHKVKVYRADIASITESSIKLDDTTNTTINADALIYATGWTSTIPYLSPTAAQTLGVPSPITSTSPPRSETEKWQKLETAAVPKILHRFPLLSTSKLPPYYVAKPRQYTPYHLYNSIVPVSDQSIAFLGKTNLANHTYNAEIQAVYAVAVLDGSHKLPSRTQMEERIAEVRAWQDLRYPAHGPGGEFMHFDVVGYTDCLLGEMGVRSHRRGVLEAISAGRLKGVVREWKGLVEKKVVREGKKRV